MKYTITEQNTTKYNTTQYDMTKKTKQGKFFAIQLHTFWKRVNVYYCFMKQILFNQKYFPYLFRITYFVSKCFFITYSTDLFHKKYMWSDKRAKGRNCVIRWIIFEPWERASGVQIWSFFSIFGYKTILNTTENGYAELFFFKWCFCLIVAETHFFRSCTPLTHIFSTSWRLRDACIS